MLLNAQFQFEMFKIELQTNYKRIFIHIHLFESKRDTVKLEMFAHD